MRRPAELELPVEQRQRRIGEDVQDNLMSGGQS
jgi:hypothetical protein